MESFAELGVIPRLAIAATTGFLACIKTSTFLSSRHFRLQEIIFTEFHRPIKPRVPKKETCQGKASPLHPGCIMVISWSFHGHFMVHMSCKTKSKRGSIPSMKRSVASSAALPEELTQVDKLTH